MLTPKEHRQALRAFEVDRLLKMFTIEAKKHHDGHYTIFSFTTGFKAAFGTPDLDSSLGREEVDSLPTFRTLKEALIEALVSEPCFGDGD
jgi:hypothetical protein